MTTRKIQHEGGSDASSPTEFLIGETTVDAAGRVVERKRPDADGTGETTTIAYAVLTGGKLKTTVIRSVDSGATGAVEETTALGQQRGSIQTGSIFCCGSARCRGRPGAEAGHCGRHHAR